MRAKLLFAAGLLAISMGAQSKSLYDMSGGDCKVAYAAASFAMGGHQVNLPGPDVIEMAVRASNAEIVGPLYVRAVEFSPIFLTKVNQDKVTTEFANIIYAECLAGK